MILLLFIAGMLTTGSANAINQAVEKDTDAMMKRTAARPIADGRMSRNEAYTFALIAGLVGIWMIGWFLRPMITALTERGIIICLQSFPVCIYLYTAEKSIP